MDYYKQQLESMISKIIDRVDRKYHIMFNEISKDIINFTEDEIQMWLIIIGTIYNERNIESIELACNKLYLIFINK